MCHFLKHTALVLVGMGLLPPLGAAPLITEICADNETVLADEDGEYSDWIEVHNPDPVSVDLTGWALTDDSGDLAKWVFPAVSLAPGEFRVVFASGRNRRDPERPLHANFALAAGGEYLALVGADGVVAHGFAPAFPPQESDRSFGSAFGTEPLLRAGASARVLVPGDGGLGMEWIGRGYEPDGAWIEGPTGMGFGLLVPGFTVREVRPGTGVYDLFDSERALALANPLAEDTRVRPWLNLLSEDSEDGHFPGDESFVVGPENHALRATGQLVLSEPGIWTFGVSANDGAWLRIDGSEVLVDPNQGGTRDILGSPVELAAGMHAVELVFYSAVGGDALELFAAEGARGAFGPGFHLVGDVASGGLPVFTLPGGAGMEAVIGTDIGDAMRGVNAGAYVRIPFEVSDPAAVDGLSLAMRFNDGFVAWLNGIEVARWNAPLVPGWDSGATAAREIGDAYVRQTFNATAAKAALVAGTNVLAIHGLNVAASDASFLVLPELSSSTPLEGGPYVFNAPTPGGVNGPPTSLGRVRDTVFSVMRGIYDAPVSVAIATETPGATIRYTIDGSVPTETHGNDYTDPLELAATTVLRAAAFKAGYDPTNVDTHSYVFPADLAAQSPDGLAPPGWPTAFSFQRWDYGMDPEIVGNADPAIGGEATVVAALNALPLVSLVLDQDDFSGEEGIYANAYERGRAWERAASIELLNDRQEDAGGASFQAGCGLRIRGNYSRAPDNPKHSFRVFFRGEYGDGKLRYRLFGDAGAAEFDGFDIQTPHDAMWAYSESHRATYLRDTFCRATAGDMGMPVSRSRPVHVCVNGIYWGVYQLEERPEASWGASYLDGGDRDDYDVIKTTGQAGGYAIEATDGELTGPPGAPAAWENLWNQMRAHAAAPSPEGYFAMQGLAPDGVAPTDGAPLLDARHFADYIVWLFQTANTDVGSSQWVGGRPNNFFAVRKRAGARGFVFVPRDTEISLDWFANDYDVTGPVTDPDLRGDFTAGNPEFFHADLLGNEEYRLLVADRARRALFHGALTPEACRARWDRLAAELDAAIVAESARWGDAQRAQPYTRADWLANVAAVRAWFEGRREEFLGQLRDDGLYPEVPPPAFSPHGGMIANGGSVTLASGGGAIHYTLDGADPRVVGGAVHPSAREYSGSEGEPVLAGPAIITLKARTLLAGEWSALEEAEFLVGAEPVAEGRLAVSEIHYHPVPDGEAEFLELLNVGHLHLDLRGARFTRGIDFVFPATQPLLAPGERILLVRNAAAFAAVYGGMAVAGEYGGSLDNAGERLRALGADDTVLLDFHYGDAAPWPGSADGVGASLVLVNPEGFSAYHGEPAHWRASVGDGGNPGSSDAVPPPVDPLGDGDGDGVSDLIDYALGEGVGLGIETAPDGSLTLVQWLRAGADSAVVRFEGSADFREWTELTLTLLGESSSGMGMVRRVYAFPDGGIGYVRLRVTLIEQGS